MTSVNLFRTSILLVMFLFVLAVLPASNISNGPSRPGGTTTAVQFNNSNAFGGDATKLAYTGTSVDLAVILNFLADGTPTDKEIRVQDQSTSNTAGNALNIFSGKGLGTGNGGSLSLFGGDSGASGTTGGGVSLFSGFGGGDGGPITIGAGGSLGTGSGGGITITGGDASGNGKSGGSILIAAGNGSSGDSNGGDIIIISGLKNAGGADGNITLSTGTSGNVFLNATLIKLLGNVYTVGTAPSASAGTLNAKATDMAGKLTSATTGAFTSTLTFGTAWSSAPACTATNETTANLLRATSTTTTVVIAGVTANGDVLSYICLGMKL